MPKGKNRRKGASNSSKSSAAAAQNFDLDVDDRSTCYGGDDDNDAASTCTGFSLMSDSSAPSCGGGGGEVDDVEGKLSACAEMLGEKSSRQRLNAILGLKKILQHSCVHDFVSRFRETLCDGLERSLRKGSSEEKCAAVDVIALLAIQGGEVYKEVDTTLLKCIKDSSTCSYQTRAKCCTALVIASVLSDDVENDDVTQALDAMQQVFSGSYLKGDSSVPVLKTGCDVLHASAIRAWSFLVTSYHDVTIPRDVVNKMEDFLHSRELAIRVEGGHAVALLSERGDLNCDDDVSEVARMLGELATDSSKSKSKKERREQRVVFRDLLASVEHDHYYQACIKFGTEALELDGWGSKIQYDTFKSVLTTGVNLHLARNPVLRQFWSLLPPKLDFDADDSESAASSRKSNRLERQLYREAGRKLQSQARGKKRDKRAAVF